MTAAANTSNRAPEARGGPINLFGLDRTALRARFAEMGEAPYRADQVMNWIYRRGADGFALMSNLGKDLRAKLASVFVIQPPELITEQVSADGTRKWVTKAGEGQAIETVFIPEDDRGTLCISSQVGCAMDCSFCATGAQGFSRNLSTAEIVAQVWFAAKTLGGDFQRDRVVSNVVFMGMGEPLANYGEVLPALRILLDDHGFGLSRGASRHPAACLTVPASGW
jgi:23S rRNA (adenine2503-C2)-methyltransferase